jgi:hypothetical protein
VPVRRPLARILLWSGAIGGGALGVIGGLSLRGPGLVAVGLAATLAACTAAGIARESSRHDRRTTIESAVQASAWTVGALLVLSGIAALAGGGVAALVVGAALAGWLVRSALRIRPGGTAATARPVSSSPGGAGVLFLPVPPPEIPGFSTGARSAGMPVPVWTLPTPALGQDWLDTTAALAGPLSPSERESLVHRREQVLDELERRDPEGFAQWLAVGPNRGSDPADYVRGGPVHNGPAADTDAA